MKFNRGPKWLAIPKKSTCRDCLSNGYLNTVSNFNFKKVDKSAYFQRWFDQPQTREKKTPNLIKIGFHAYLSNGYLEIEPK